jgi:hypothetical protein
MSGYSPAAVVGLESCRENSVRPCTLEDYAFEQSQTCPIPYDSCSGVGQTINSRPSTKNLSSVSQSILQETKVLDNRISDLFIVLFGSYPPTEPAEKLSKTSGIEDKLYETERNVQNLHKRLVQIIERVGGKSNG